MICKMEQVRIPQVDIKAGWENLACAAPVIMQNNRTDVPDANSLKNKWRRKLKIVETPEMFQKS